MKLLVAIAGFFILFATLWEAFETIILPRRVTRPFRLVRMFYRVTWTVWAAVNRLIRSKKVRDAHLSYYGPLSLLGLFATWAFLLVLGFRDAALGCRFGHQRAGRNADVPDRFLFERNDVLHAGIGRRDAANHAGASRSRSPRAERASAFWAS